MSDSERAAVVATLPDEFPLSEAHPPPEGDPHIDNWAVPRQTLRRWSRKRGRRMYVGGNMAIYYPGESMFSPDLFAVLDVSDHQRNSWIVSQEERGLDLALEVVVRGSRRKDLEGNLERYARLGITEYFVLDWRLGKLHGYRLPEPGAIKYHPIVPQGGRYHSEVLGLQLFLLGGQLHFAQGDHVILHDDELINQLSHLITEAESRASERLQSLQTELSEEQRLREEEQRRREELEQEVERLQAQLREEKP